MIFNEMFFVRDTIDACENNKKIMINDKFERNVKEKIKFFCDVLLNTDLADTLMYKEFQRFFDRKFCCEAKIIFFINHFF